MKSPTCSARFLISCVLPTDCADLKAEAEVLLGSRLACRRPGTHGVLPVNLAWETHWCGLAQGLLKQLIITGKGPTAIPPLTAVFQVGGDITHQKV